DSISGVTWLRRVNEKYQTTVEATKIYSHPTLKQLSRYVRDEAEKQGTLSIPEASSITEIPVAFSEKHDPPVREASSTQKSETNFATKGALEKLVSWRNGKTRRFANTVVSESSHAGQAIAVIGMSGQFPQAKNLDEYWQNIAEGKNCISQVP